MSQPKIIHESRTQRQHARVRLPATVGIDGTSYRLRDLSASGMAVEDVPLPFEKGQHLPLTLTFDLEGFSFSLHLKTLVTHYDRIRKTLGCAFDDLTREQISALNAVIKSYLSGILISQPDLLAIVARDNFALARKSPAPSHKGTLKKTGMPLLVGIAAFCTLFFLTSNLYEKLTVIKSYDASVRGDTVIETLLSSRDAHRLRVDNRATVRITGDEIPRAGIVENLRTIADNPALTTITVRLQDTVPAALAGHPAYIEFFLR